MNNDIGLIILEKDVPSSVAMPVKLFAGDSDYDTPVTAAGFGITDPENDSSVPKELMEVDLHLGKDDYCKKKYALYQNKYLVCTDGTAGIDTCLGDSGGPLSTPFENEDDSGSAILGVTSFAPSSTDNPKGACAQAGGSGYYTRVSTYISWIASSCNLDIKSISVNNSTVTNKADAENKQSQDENDNNKTSKDGEEEQGNLEDDNESNKDNKNSTDNNSDEEPHTSTVFVDPSTTHIVTMTSEHSSSSDDSAASSLYSNSVIMRSVACAFVAVLVATAI
ncbi:Kallikrein-14 [Coemansia sp. RSA 485]|nr:Kallikrein-14 [Coemansia sp. RSA 485]